MTTVVCAAGIDVGWDYFDVGLAPSGGVFRFGNGPGGVEAIVARLQGAGVVRVVLESIGGFSARLVRGSADAAKPPAMAP
jgi:transposase